jgi:hypothetical protein
MKESERPEERVVSGERERREETLFTMLLDSQVKGSATIEGIVMDDSNLP